MATRGKKKAAARKAAAEKPTGGVPAKREETRASPWRSLLGEPFREIARLRREMDRILEGAPFHFGGRLPSLLEETPKLDCYQEDGTVIVKAEVPGMEKADLDVSIDGDVLTVRGEKKKEEDVHEGDYSYRERSYGFVSRSIRLPTDVNAAKAKATFKNGVLTMRLPKSEEAKQRTRTVKIE